MGDEQCLVLCTEKDNTNRSPFSSESKDKSLALFRPSDDPQQDNSTTIFGDDICC